LGCFLKPALKRIAIAVLLVWAAMLWPAAIASADSPAAAPSPAAKPVKSSRKKGGIPAPVRAEHGGTPVTVTGQQTIYDSKTDTFVVKGDAVMSQGGSVLKADEIDIMRRDRHARAIGHVHLIDPEIEMWATDGTIDITNETMVLNNAKILAKKDIYHLEGKQIVKLEGQSYEVKDGFFTTCGCEKGTPDWSINADQMVVNMGHTGTAKNATFDVAGYPIMKTPYLIFPADTSRHSGLLMGREGESGLRGYQWLQPYYIAINKSSDATVAFDVETSQRVGGLAEYRLVNGKDDYLSVNGAFYDESIRSDANRQKDIAVDPQMADPHIPLDRYGLIGMTREHLTKDLIAYGDTVSVSDSLYLREMDVWTLSRGFGSNFNSMRNAPSDFGLLDQFEDAFVRLGGTWNQDLIQPQQFALQRLPDLTVTGRQELFNNLMFADYDAEAVNFYRYQGIDGARLDANPRITLPWRLGDYLQGYEEIGSQAAFYDTAGHNLQIIPVATTPSHSKNSTCASGGGTELTLNNCVELSPFTAQGTSARIVPYATAGISTVLDRVYDVEWKSIEKLKNTIEPFANYYYVPNIYQGNMPLFDSVDRLNSRSLFTYGFTTNLFVKSSGLPPEETTTEPTPTEGLSDADSTVGLSNEEPIADSLVPHAGNTVRERDHSSEIGSLTIQQAYDIGHQVANGSHMSDIEALMHIYASRVVSFSSQLDYSPRAHAGVTLADAWMSYQPPWSSSGSKTVIISKAVQGSFLEFGFSYANRTDTVIPGTNKNASEYISAAAYTELFDFMGVYFSPNYDFASGQALWTEYGVQLKSPCDCWAADFGITDSVNPNEVQFQFQLTLGGLGSYGKSPFGRNPFQAGSPTGVLPNY
jgi:lipopolysaccharide assembly outer membrane protein LptD (OstA)